MTSHQQTLSLALIHPGQFSFYHRMVHNSLLYLSRIFGRLTSTVLQSVWGSVGLFGSVFFFLKCTRQYFENTTLVCYVDYVSSGILKAEVLGKLIISTEAGKMFFFHLNTALAPVSGSFPRPLVLVLS